MTSLDGPRAAVAAGDWRLGLDLLEQIGPELDPAGLELLAQAAYGHGELERSIAAWERLHQVSLDAGDDQEAARAAVMVALFLLIDTGLLAPVRGWVSRSQRLLRGAPPGPVHAMVAMVRGYERLFQGDLPAAERHASEAVRLGGEYDVLPATVFGSVARARIRMAEGEVAAGLEQLDEVATLLMGGGADALTTGMMYCELVCAAQNVGASERAAEWTDAMQRWSERSGFGSIKGRCRVHRAELLRVSGPAEAAEAEALAACAELRPWMRREFGWPLIELGEIRLRKGDLAGAEESFLEAHARAWTPQPGLALVRLAQGETAAARAMIEAALAHPVPMPSKEWPPVGELRLVPLLDAQSEIGWVGGDQDAVRAAAAALARIADRFPSNALAARAALARGRELLLTGEPGEAVGPCAEAVVGWTALEAPYEAGLARIALGHAQRAAGYEELAHLEWQVAERSFATYGADLRAAEAASLAGAGPVRPLPGSQEPARGVFRGNGGSRRIEFGGRCVDLPDLTGLRYLARLLAEPDREFHVLDLVTAERGADEAGLPVLDDEARAAYRRRLADVDEDIEEARATNDLGRLELAQRDRDYLVAELAGAVGLGGRARTTGSTAERARTSVARSLRYAVARINEQHPELGSHLANTLHTGTYCRYTPDLLAPVAWETGR